MNSDASDRKQAAEAVAGPHPDERWRSIILKGNAAFRAGDKDAALLLYLEGIAEANRLLQAAHQEAAPRESDPVPALVVAASNAANIYADRAVHSEAKQIMHRVTTLLRATIVDKAAPRHVRMSCLQHVNRALAYLVEHMRRAGDSDTEIASEISAVRDAANGRLKLVMGQHLH